MNKSMHFNQVITPLAALTLLLLSIAFVAPAKANPIEQTAPTATTAPVQLAYYRWGWGGWGHRGYLCPRTCWRGAWGFWHCVRRC